MGKDRRKKDGAKKQTSSEADVGPKGQREPRNREQQREASKNTEDVKKEKSVETGTPLPKDTKPEPIDTTELFANLKRETDEIKALTEKKFSKRHISSNWERYEEPSCEEPQYEVEMQGADFESLVKAPTSGHFQFKSERKWDAEVAGLSGELFSLDMEVLSVGLATIPLYKKLNVPTSLFSKEEIVNMDRMAEQASRRYETTKNQCDKRAANPVNKLLDILMAKEPSPARDENKPVLSFDIDQDEIAEVDVTEEVPASANDSSALKQLRKEVTAPTDARKENTPPKEELKNFTKESTPLKGSKRELPPSSVKETKVEEPKQEDTQTSAADSWDVVPEPVVPLGQRSGRRKARGQAQGKPEPEPEPKLTAPKPELTEPSSEQMISSKPQRTISDTKQTVSKSQSMAQKSEPVQMMSKPQPTLSDTKQTVSKSQSKAQKSEPVQMMSKPQPTLSETKQTVSISQSKAQKSEPVQSIGPVSHAQQTQRVPAGCEDDLDFLLALKKPVQESQISPVQSSQVAKPSIEEDDAAGSSQFPMPTSQKQTEDLEDWLDSMLDD